MWIVEKIFQFWSVRAVGKSTEIQKCQKIGRRLVRLSFSYLTGKSWLTPENSWAVISDTCRRFKNWTLHEWGSGWLLTHFKPRGILKSIRLVLVTGRVTPIYIMHACNAQIRNARWLNLVMILEWQSKNALKCLDFFAKKCCKVLIACI